MCCQCRTYLDPSEVFKGEVDETVLKVKVAVTNLLALKDVYEQYRKKLTQYFTQGEPKEWEFAPVLVFHRYDKFIERVQLIYVRFTVQNVFCYASPTFRPLTSRGAWGYEELPKFQSASLWSGYIELTV